MPADVGGLRVRVGHSSRCTLWPMSVETVDTDVYFAEAGGREYTFALSEAQARKLAETSTVVDDPSDWRIVRRRVPVIHVAGEPRGVQGETCHVGWKCPLCEQTYSDDVEPHEIGPLLTCCGRKRFHSDGQDAWVLLKW